MDDTQTRKLRKIYLDIIQGYSSFSIESKQYFIRHPSTKHFVDLDEIYQFYYNEAIEQNLPSEKDRLEFLNKTGEWTDSDEKEIHNIELFIDGLIKNKKNLKWHSEIIRQNQLIEEQKKILNDKKQKRESLILLTPESYAAKKINSAYVYDFVYLDKNLQLLAYSKEEYENLEHEDLFKIESAYVNVLQNVNENNIKKIAIAPFFQNTFVLCENDIYQYYGKPIIDLTFHQIELFSLGRIYRHVFENNQNIPKEMMNDPDLLLDWSKATDNVKKQLEKTSNSDMTMIMGATKEDLEMAGLKGQVKSMKSNKNMDMMEFLKHTGKI